VDALTAALRGVTMDHALRDRLGAAGALRVRRDFTLPQMADRFVSFCQEVAAS